MDRLLVESIAWERITLTLLGTVTPADAAEKVVRGLALEHAETGRRVALATRVDADGRFSASVSVMLAAEQYPLADGTWRLVTGDPQTAAAASEAAFTAPGVEKLFEGPSFRYEVAVTREKAAGGLQLLVTSAQYRSVPPGTSLPPWLWRALNSVRNAGYGAVYSVARALVPKNGRRVLFASDSRASLSGNLQLIHDRMVERGLDRDFEIAMSFKHGPRASRPFAEKFAFAYRLATADVILVDDYHPMVYKVRYDAHVRIIQVWHASGAFKTVGYSRVGKPGGPNPFSGVHKNYTAAIVSSPHDVPFYAEAFGLPEKRVVPTGIPRMDLFFDEDRKAALREDVLETFPAARGRTVILFAPTFRGQGPSDAHYDFDLLDLPALHALCEELDAVCIFKMHPFVREPLAIPAGFEDRFFDATHSREINDFLIAADLVITDYSSLVFEYSTLGRPMLFFAYDLDEYIAERDFYEPYQTFVPGRIVRTFAELLDAIRAGDFEFEKVARFAEEHVSHRDAGSTDRVIDELVIGARPR